MEAKSARTRWTYAEFARLPSDTGMRHEVIDGKLVVTPAPALRHQRIVTRLAVVLAQVADSGFGEVFVGPVDVIFGESDYLEPDLVAVSSSRRALMTDRGVEGPPDLIVEVTSPSTAARDRGLKRDRYQTFGVPEYWIVDLDATRIERWIHGRAGPDLFEPGDVLEWTLAGAPPISVDVGALLAD